MILGGTQRSWREVWPWPLAAVPLVLAIALVPTTALPLTGGYAVAADRAGDRWHPAESPLSEWGVPASHSARGR